MTPESQASADRNLRAVRWLLDQALPAEHEHRQILMTSAVFWVTATHEVLRSSLIDDRERYLSAIDKTVDGRTITGLYVARNEAAHGTSIIVGGQGLQFPLFAFGFLDFGGRWVKTDHLRAAAAAAGRSATVNEKRWTAYEEGVADRAPLDPIERAHNFLTSWLPTN